MTATDYAVVERPCTEKLEKKNSSGLGGVGGGLFFKHKPIHAKNRRKQELSDFQAGDQKMTKQVGRRRFYSPDKGAGAFAGFFFRCGFRDLLCSTAPPGPCSLMAAS